MVMSKKHFIHMAEILKKHEASEALCKEVGQMFALYNSNFNMLKFLEAALGVDLTS